MRSGFTAIYIDAAKMDEGSLPFAVIIEDNKIKAYGVNRENWNKIEREAEIYVNAGSCQPLVCLDQAFRDTARQMGWVVVGEVDADDLADNFNAKEQRIRAQL